MLFAFFDHAIKYRIFICCPGMKTVRFHKCSKQLGEILVFRTVDVKSSKHYHNYYYCKVCIAYDLKFNPRYSDLTDLKPVTWNRVLHPELQNFYHWLKFGKVSATFQDTWKSQTIHDVCYKTLHCSRSSRFGVWRTEYLDIHVTTRSRKRPVSIYHVNDCTILYVLFINTARNSIRKLDRSPSQPFWFKHH